MLLKHNDLERQVKKMAKCDGPLKQKNGYVCLNPVHTEWMLRDRHNPERLEHFLWFCREHSGTQDEIVIVGGDFCDGPECFE